MGGGVGWWSARRLALHRSTSGGRAYAFASAFSTFARGSSTRTTSLLMRTAVTDRPAARSSARRPLSSATSVFRRAFATGVFGAFYRCAFAAAVIARTEAFAAG